MTTALEPGWYADPYGDSIERFHDGNGWTDRIRRPGVAESLVEQTVTPPSKALGRFVGIIAAGLAFVGEVVPAVGQIVFGIPLALSLLVVFAIWAALILVAAPYASCPRWVVLAPIIPVFGVFMMIYFAYVISSRLVYLPYRDWPLQADEMDRWRQVRNADDPDQVLYIKR